MASDIDVPVLNISVDGAALSDEKAATINWVSVEDELNVPAMFTINLSTLTIFDEAFEDINLKTFDIGKTVKVEMGLDKASDMMTGEVAIIEPYFGDGYYVNIGGYDRLYRMKFGTQCRAFQNVSSSDIASRLAGEAGLSPDVDSTTGTYANLIQNNQSNYELLMKLAGEINYEMLVDDTRFIFRQAAEGGSPRVTLEYPEALTTFRARLQTITRGSKVTVKGWDAQNKQAITGTAERVSAKLKMGGQETGYEVAHRFPDAQVTIPNLMVLDGQGAKTIAEAQSQGYLDQFITGELVSRGNPQLRAGVNIELKGLGERFSGRYYITASRHDYDAATGYTTTCQVRRTGI